MAFQVVYVLVLVLSVPSAVIGILKFLLQLEQLRFQLLNLITLQIDKLEHLEILLLVLTKNPQQLIKILNLSGSLNLREVLPEFLDLLSLFRILLCLSKIIIICTYSVGFRLCP